MKFIVVLAQLAIMFSCNTQTTETTKNNIINNDEISALACESALKFANEYVSSTVRSSPVQNDSAWLYRNPLLSAKFISEYRMLIDSANKADPEFGLGFDPVLDAQDYPDKGFEIATCNNETGYVSLLGKGWKDFYLTVKMVFADSIWLVDGSGIINIPPDKRAKR